MIEGAINAIVVIGGRLAVGVVGRRITTVAAVVASSVVSIGERQVYATAVAVDGKRAQHCHHHRENRNGLK